MLFETLFFAGVGGLVLMTLLSFVHGGAHHMMRGAHFFGGHHGHVGLGHAGHGLHAGGHHSIAARNVHIQDTAAATATSHAAGQVRNTASLLAFIPSPIDVFSMCIGAGLVGMLSRSLTYPLPYLFAVLGAIAFDFGIVRPMFGLLFQFASKPSEGLEGTIALEAEAVTKFDEKGQGLVRINMEGQLVQLLARLDSGDLAGGVVVHKGDTLVVTSVNATANTCRVTRQLSLE